MVTQEQTGGKLLIWQKVLWNRDKADSLFPNRTIIRLLYITNITIEHQVSSLVRLRRDRETFNQTHIYLHTKTG